MYEDGLTSGSIVLGIFKISNNSSSHFKSYMLYTKVREAFVQSVTWVFPLDNFQMSHVSIVPNNSSLLFAFSRAPSILSKIHFILRSEERRVGKECRFRWSPSPLEENWG